MSINVYFYIESCNYLSARRKAYLVNCVQSSSFDLDSSENSNGSWYKERDSLSGTLTTLAKSVILQNYLGLIVLETKNGILSGKHTGNC